MTPDQLLLVLALAEPSLLGDGRCSSVVPASSEAARRLGWTITKFNRKLDNVYCRITFDDAVKAVEKANELYKDKGKSAGTGMYVWCIDNKGLSILVDPSMAHVAISNYCPEYSIK